MQAREHQTLQLDVAQFTRIERALDDQGQRRAGAHQGRDCLHQPRRSVGRAKGQRIGGDSRQ